MQLHSKVTYIHYKNVFFLFRVKNVTFLHFVSRQRTHSHTWIIFFRDQFPLCECYVSYVNREHLVQHMAGIFQYNRHLKCGSHFSSGRISLSGGVVVVVVAVAVARRCITINLSSFLALSLCAITGGFNLFNCW